MRVRDFRGNEYGVGDTVLYPRMSGRSCEMQEAIVLEFKPFEDHKDERNPFFDDSRPANWNDNKRYVRKTFTNYKVRVKPTRSSREFYRTGSEDVKPVIISIIKNIVKA